jgi:hypothetical protein
MPTNYPDDFDSFNNPNPNDQLNDILVPHHLQHTNANDAIEAIENELGLNPSGTHASVLDRFENGTVDGGTF